MDSVYMARHKNTCVLLAAPWLYILDSGPVLVSICLHKDMWALSRDYKLAPLLMNVLYILKVNDLERCPMVWDTVKRKHHPPVASVFPWTPWESGSGSLTASSRESHIAAAEPATILLRRQLRDQRLKAKVWSQSTDPSTDLLAPIYLIFSCLTLKWGW